MNKIAVQKCSLGGGFFLQDSVFLPQSLPGELALLQNQVTVTVLIRHFRHDCSLLSDTSLYGS